MSPFSSLRVSDSAIFKAAPEQLLSLTSRKLALPPHAPPLHTYCSQALFEYIAIYVELPFSKIKNMSVDSPSIRVTAANCRLAHHSGYLQADEYRTFSFILYLENNQAEWRDHPFQGWNLDSDLLRK